MTNKQQLWTILDRFGDLIRYGEQTEHAPPPSFAAPASQTVETTATARATALEEIAARVRECTQCALSAGRTKAVPGIGVLDPVVMVIGEGPGAEEDRTGEPFVGRAGQYLDKWLAAIGVTRRENAFIANIVKCRPPGNRDPRPEESAACMPYLREQIALIRPRAILTVGRIATSLLVDTSAGIGSLRGRTFYVDGYPLIPTYHPSAVLRNPDLRKPVWEDLKRLAELVGLQIA